MKKVFLDANVVVDYMDSSSKDHSTAVDCINILRKHFNHFGKPVVSPITFVIADFILGKFARNRQWHKQQMQLTFSGFDITPVHPSFVDNIFETYFNDLEDGLQHQCALHAKAFVILTKDIKDYFDSKVPPVHPMDFVMRYKKIIL